ncbi:MAG: 6-phosphogluconolactonase [Alphaproteobacteria bacterium]|nr:MAG: 6-phosphogluconolactonase [Alphaproteobacteria bacterium]
MEHDTMTHTDMTVHTHDSATSCAEALAQDVVFMLREAVLVRGRASLVVSGGSTPVPFFHALNHADLPWDYITVLVADERWVMLDDAQSNEGLVRHHITNAKHIFSLAPTHADETVEEGAYRIDASMHLNFPDAFDVVILGMGEDGHTASLFPRHPALVPSLAHDAPHCMAINDSPKPPAQRVTLSASRLAKTRHLLLHLVGQSKYEVLLHALNDEDIGAMPIRYFLLHPTHKPTIYWAKS